MPNSPPFFFWGIAPHLQYGAIMILYVPVLLKEIYQQGRKYPWKRPEACLRCQHYRVWGHGFVQRYFDGFATCLYLKCYRCPNCRCVITLRPATHFSRIRSSKETIRSHLCHRLAKNRWPPSSLPRPRLRHWLTNLNRQILAHLTSAWDRGLLAGFDALLFMGLVPVALVS